jgi:hypothetical protein
LLIPLNLRPAPQRVAELADRAVDN